MKTYHLNNDIIVTQEQLDHWNEQLIKLETPQEIIAWSIVTFPHLFQTTAFGLTGLVTIDMLSKLSEKYYMPELLFIDTLHHFPQTLTLKNEIEKNTTSLKIKPFTYISRMDVNRRQILPRNTGISYGRKMMTSTIIWPKWNLHIVPTKSYI